MMDPVNPEPVLEYERTPQFVAVARFADAAEARLAAARLESEDVDCDVLDRPATHGLGVGGATLAVEQDQLARAVEVLSATPARRWLLVKPAVAVGEVVAPGAPHQTAKGLLHRLKRWCAAANR
jgi:hypothetical protein